MAGSKWSALDPLSSVADGDLVAMVDVSDTSSAPTGTSKKVTATTVATYIGTEIAATNAQVIAGALTNKAVPPAGLKAAVFDVEPVNVARYGYTKTDVIAAMDEAESRGVATVVYFPAGIYDLGTGLSLSGYTCQLRGDGAGGSTADPAGTVLYASSQTGPVLNYTGYLQPDSFKGRVSHGGFRVVGSGAADATKVRTGVTLFSMGSARFHDIVVEETGGPCWEHAGPLGSVYLCDFERITLVTPVSASANDVAYLKMAASNGNRWRGLGLRSVTSGADTGVSGAIILTDDGTYPPHDNLFDAPWIEFLHVPTNGTIFAIAGNANVIDGLQLFDCSKVSGATGTSVFRFTAPSVSDTGGNMVRGYIPGKGTSATSFDTGIDMQQSRNTIRGIKGYRGTNVTLASGVGFTDIELGGSEAAATDVAVVDNSAATTNRYVDHYLKTVANDGWRRDTGTAAGARGARYLEALTGTNGLVYIGSSGVYIRTVGAGAFFTSDTIQFRNTALTGAPTFTIGGSSISVQVRIGTGTPEGAVTAPVGSIFMRTDGGAGTILYQKESGASSTGWTALKGTFRTALTKTGNYTLAVVDDVTIFNGSSITATLPTAASITGRVYIIKNIHSTALTIATTSSQTIDGAAPGTLAQWGVLTVMSDGSNWLTI